MKLYLTRHGETELNQRRCFYGSLDTKLSEKGRAQGQAMNRQAQGLSFTKVYTSSLSRTKNTADLILKGLPKTYTLKEVPGLDERDFGLWEGLTADEIEARYYENWWDWINDPFGVNPLEAETFADFKKRVLQSFEEIRADFQADDQVLLVGHLGALRLISQHFLKDSRGFWDIKFDQG